MSLTAPDLRTSPPDLDGRDVEGSWVEPVPPAEDDTLVVTCAACGTRQRASGHSLGYTCHTCGSAWRVMRCRGCRKASVVLDGASTCPRCGHEHAPRAHAAGSRPPSWLTEPDPLSVWLGGVKYLGGHAERDQPVSTAGLLLDRRGIHLRAFAELFSIRWDTVLGIDIEGPHEISERLTMTRLLSAGATTWAMQVAYLTVHTSNGDAIFEVDGLGPPELHARLSRVLQGLQRSEHPPAPIALERGSTAAPSPSTAPVLAPEPEPESEPAPAPAVAETWVPVPAQHTPLAIDPERSDAPLEVLVVDALWKLAHLREVGLLDDVEARALRERLLARVPELASTGDPANGAGPLLHV